MAAKKTSKSKSKSTRAAKRPMQMPSHSMTLRSHPMVRRSAMSRPPMSDPMMGSSLGGPSMHPALGNPMHPSKSHNKRNVFLLILLVGIAVGGYFLIDELSSDKKKKKKKDTATATSTSAPTSGPTPAPTTAAPEDEGDETGEAGDETDEVGGGESTEPTTSAPITIPPTTIPPVVTTAIAKATETAKKRRGWIAGVVFGVLALLVIGFLAYDHFTSVLAFEMTGRGGVDSYFSRGMDRVRGFGSRMRNRSNRAGESFSSGIAAAEEEGSDLFHDAKEEAEEVASMVRRNSMPALERELSFIASEGEDLAATGRRRATSLI